MPSEKKILSLINLVYIYMKFVVLTINLCTEVFCLLNSFTTLIYMIINSVGYKWVL